MAHGRASTAKRGTRLYTSILTSPQVEVSLACGAIHRIDPSHCCRDLHQASCARDPYRPAARKYAALTGLNSMILVTHEGKAIFKRLWVR